MSIENLDEFCEVIVNNQSSEDDNNSDDASPEEQSSSVDEGSNLHVHTNDEETRESVLPPLLFPSETINEATFSAVRKKHVVLTQNFYRDSAATLTFEDEDLEFMGNYDRFRNASFIKRRFSDSIKDEVDFFRIVSGKYRTKNTHSYRISMHNESRAANYNRHVFHKIEEKHKSFYDPAGNFLQTKFNIVLDHQYMLLDHTWSLRDLPAGTKNYLPALYFFGEDYSRGIALRNNRTLVEHRSNPPILQFGKRFYDFYHTTELPFYGSEIKKLTYGKSSTLDISVHTNYVNKKTKEITEEDMNSMYDLYQAMIDSDEKTKNLTLKMNLIFLILKFTTLNPLNSFQF